MYNNFNLNKFPFCCIFLSAIDGEANGYTSMLSQAYNQKSVNEYDF